MCCCEIRTPDNHKDPAREAAREVLAETVAHLTRLGLDRLAIRALLAELLIAQGGRHGR